MFDLSLHNILHSNLLNFVLLVIILYALVAPILKKSVKESNEKTKNIINDSIKQKEQALNNLEETKKDFAKTPQETAEISEIADKTIKSLEQKSQEDTEKNKQIISDNFAKAVQNETTKINLELTKETAEQSVQKALETIKEELAKNSELHNTLIERAIDELEII